MKKSYSGKAITNNFELFTQKIEKVLNFLVDYDTMIIPHLLLEYWITMTITSNRNSLRFFYYKTADAPSWTFPVGNSQEVCVVTNGAMRFGCVVPFGTTHFLFKEENPMKAERINILKYITFGSLIVCIINCLMFLIRLFESGFDNATIVGCLFITYTAEGVGFFLKALGVWKNNVKLSADILLVLSSSLIYFVELFAFEHNWTLLLTALGFFALMLMNMYHTTSDTDNKSFAFFIIAVLLFGYVFCSNTFLTIRDLIMGESLMIVNFLLFFISELAMIFYCFWLFGIWYGSKGKFTFKDTVSRIKSQLTDKEYVFTVDKNGVGHISGFKQNTRNRVKIKRFILTDLQQNPTEYIYTSATVGGITTGGVTKIGGNYKYTSRVTNKYKLHSSLSGKKKNSK